MAASIARSILTVRSTGATASLLIHKRLFSSTVSKPPPLPGLARFQISTTRSVAPALSHTVRVSSPSRINQVRCRVNRSGSAYSPLNSGSNFSDRPPTEMAPLFPGCDYEHWLIVMDKPGGEGATKQQMIDCYIQTLAKVVGSEEARRGYTMCLVKGTLGSGVRLMKRLQTSLKDYAWFRSYDLGFIAIVRGFLFQQMFFGHAELLVNGEIVQRSPERQRRVEPVPQRAQDRPRYNDRTRYVRRRDNTR
ncbi:UNVERIFIED_CONTAM: Multiple organellar RNA editing factor 2, chloroplastic [Sesamum radiatum]|uniref:Multiple organellar RNA editing factor 2, chloroplastic n=1 Tax=Sesamum radiatum TaxID=300843 RepID=A0AAW2UU13_SESRA